MKVCATAVLAAVIALALAGCTDDDDGTTKTTLSLEQKVEQAGNKWAPLFAAADPAACGYMTQPGCAQVTCVRPPTGRTIRTCVPPALRKSFADATVRDVTINGKRAAARFSNGERVELSWVNGYAVGGIWWIDRVGMNTRREFFAAAAGAPLLPWDIADGDLEAGVHFNLDGRVLTVRLFAAAPSKTRRRVSGARIRATCGQGFTGSHVDPRATRTLLWPAGRTRVRFRFREDISRIARWCRLEDPRVGHVAFVMFGSASPNGRLAPGQKIERIGNEWARLFAAGDPADCEYAGQPVCERLACTRAGGEPIKNCTRPSAEFRNSFRAAMVEAIAIRGERAAAKFSNGEAIELTKDVSGLEHAGVWWWIAKVGGNAGERFFR